MQWKWKENSKGVGGGGLLLWYELKRFNIWTDGYLKRISMWNAFNEWILLTNILSLLPEKLPKYLKNEMHISSSIDFMLNEIDSRQTSEWPLKRAQCISSTIEYTWEANYWMCNDTPLNLIQLNRRSNRIECFHFTDVD